MSVAGVKTSAYVIAEGSPTGLLPSTREVYHTSSCTLTDARDSVRVRFLSLCAVSYRKHVQKCFTLDLQAFVVVERRRRHRRHA